jgi:hypothetical protein
MRFLGKLSRLVALISKITGLCTLLIEHCLKCIWNEISYFLKWKNSLRCSVTYFQFLVFMVCSRDISICLICKWVWICPLIYDIMLVASSSKWLNITAIIQDDNFKLHSLVNVMKHWRKTWTDSLQFLELIHLYFITV